MIRQLLIAAAALTIWACSAPMQESIPEDRPGPVEPDRPQPPSPPPPEDIIGETGDIPSRGPASEDRDLGDEKETAGFDEAVRLEVVTDFLYPGEAFRPAEGAPPVGVLLLSATQTAKNAFLCDGYLRELRTYEEAKAAEPDSEFLITYWPLAATPEGFDSCDKLMEGYDFQRASRIRTLYGLGDIEGPVVLAVDSAGQSVFLDLTDATPEASRAALNSWLALALEASEDDDMEAGAQPRAGIGAGAAAVGAGGARNLTLAAFSSRIKTRLLTSGGEGLSVTERKTGDGRTLFAYKDPDTGYRIGSSIRF